MKGYLVAMEPARGIDRLPKDQQDDLCRRWHLTELSVFGSVVRGEFTAESDIDLIVDFAPGHTPGFSFAQLHAEMEQVVGRSVHLLTRRGLEAARKTARRSRAADDIAAGSETLYTHSAT